MFLISASLLLLWLLVCLKSFFVGPSHLLLAPVGVAGGFRRKERYLLIYFCDIAHNAGIENMILEQLDSDIVTIDPDHFCTVSLSHMRLMSGRCLTGV